ncbi:adenylosuccinate synthase [candidate division WOR-3 bacterium]|nr:adenylosuccinate synthase [candidate division WOR-3 bacterium]
MPNLTIVGTQWGDEGKGKVVDYLARTAQLVVRFQGGPNAGHTVRVGDRQTILHQVPSGILTPGVRCVIGCGCVVDPHALGEETAALARMKLRARSRLTVDARAHLILPFHRQLDLLAEKHSRSPIGTTGRGIGPAYADKVGRVGIRAADLLPGREERFREKLKRNLAAANVKLMERYRAEPISFKKLAEDYWRATRELARMVGDGSRVITDALAEGKPVLFEGAQGVHLDIDFGTYPYVTGSSTGVWGVGPGTGVSPLWLEQAVGVAKAYSTRVGLGPFPTELEGEEGERLRKLGGEFGATTGRPRRCGWFDAGVVRASVRLNRLNALVITKLDVLDSFEEIRIGTGYRCGRQRLDEFDPTRADELEPVYETFAGWHETTGACRKLRELPMRARRYLRRLEELCGCPVALASVGSERRQVVEVKKEALRWLKSG